MVHGTQCPIGNCPAQKVFNSGKPVKKLEIQEPHLNNKWFELSLYPVFNDKGKVEFVTHIISDITERKKTLKNLAESRRKAEKASKAKSRFLANMSHEIRTPLNGIMGMLDLARRHMDSKELGNYLGMAGTSANRLLRIIDDILDFSKIEAGKIQLEYIPFQLRNAVEEPVQLLATQAHDKGLRINSTIAGDIPDNVLGDPGRLQQVLHNLIGNAIKFTEKGAISIQVGLSREQQDASSLDLHFQIHDTGMGLSADKLQKIFKAFQQADTSTTRKYGGTGLGLSISSHLVALMGGKIWPESIEGEGTTFHFTARFGKNEQQSGSIEAHRLTPHPTHNTDYRILLVEDEYINQKVTEALLQEDGYRVLTATNGKEALDILQTKTVDLVLMDIQMPGMDGFETTARIRRKEKNRKLPIVALTAHAVNGYREKCLAAGMNDYITKPVNLQNLQNVIEKLSSTSPPSQHETQKKIIDFDTFLVKNCQNNHTLAKEMIAHLLNDSGPLWIQELSKAIDTADTANIRVLCHSIIGTSGVLCAWQLRDAAEKLRQMAKENQQQEYKRCLKELKMVLTRIGEWATREGITG